MLQVRFSLLSMLVVLSTVLAHAGEYTPDDLLAPTIHKYDNGLTVILNSRGSSRNVSLRIVVGVGSNDFSCVDRELPHFVEHLLYSGTTAYTEAELDGFIEGWGGVWNATTNSRDTVYELDIYSAHIVDALILHYLMFTETAVTEEVVKNARGVIHAESGGRPSFVRQFLDGHGIMSSSEAHSYRQFLRGTNSFCASSSSVDSVSSADLGELLEEYYSPENMTLIAVGDFDEEEMLETLGTTFGSLATTNNPRERGKAIEVKARSLKYFTTLNPVVSNESLLSLEFQVPRAIDREKVGLMFLSDYLGAELYRRLRTKLGWAYSPTATINNYDDFGVLYLSAEVPTGREEETFGIFESIVLEVRSEGIPPDELEIFKNGFLLSQAAFYEANSDYADFYVSSLDLLREMGMFPNFEDIAITINAGMIQQLAQKYLLLDNAMYYSQQPTLTYFAFALALVILFVVLVMGIMWAHRERIRKNPQ